MKLITTNTNWADEMDVWGFEIVPNNALYEIQLKLINEALEYEENIEVSVGSNEEIYFNKYFLRNFIVKDVVQEEVDVLIKLFGSHSKGNYLFEQLVETSLYILEENDLEKFKEYNSIIYGD